MSNQLAVNTEWHFCGISAPPKAPRNFEWNIIIGILTRKTQKSQGLT